MKAFLDVWIGNLDVWIGICVILAWLMFYVAGALAVQQWLGNYACAAFIAFFTGFVLTKVQAEVYG